MCKNVVTELDTVIVVWESIHLNKSQFFMMVCGFFITGRATYSILTGMCKEANSFFVTLNAYCLGSPCACSWNCISWTAPTSCGWYFIPFSNCLFSCEKMWRGKEGMAHLRLQHLWTQSPEYFLSYNLTKKCGCETKVGYLHSHV